MSQKLLSHFLYGLLLCGTLCLSNCLWASHIQDGDDIIIIFLPPDGELPNQPRMPSTIQLYAWYSWETSSVSASLSNAGNIVAVEISNLSSLEHYSFEISGNGISVMPISGSSGHWTMSVTLASGVSYHGFFTL